MGCSIKFRAFMEGKGSVEIGDEKQDDDYVTKSIGAFGYWQLILIFIVSLTRFTTAWNTMSIVFIAPKTDFVCKKLIGNTTVEVINNTCYDTCIEYEYTSILFEETIISKFGLICKETWLLSMAQTAVMAGVLCGVTLFGWFSDRFGRRKAIILAGITCAIFMIATPFSPNFWSFAAARFFAGVGTGGYFTLTTVYMSEVVGSRIIDIILCFCLMSADGVGLCIEAAFAYFTSSHSWQTFMVVGGTVTALIVSFTFYLPDTPRWLVAKGKSAEAIELMTRAAKLNKRDARHISIHVKNVTDQLNLKKESDINLTYLDLFKTKKLATWTITSVSIWFVTGFTYFGLLQHVSSFGSNLYIVAIVLGFVQVLAAPLALALLKLCSRKVSSTSAFAMIGVLSLALVFTSKGSTAAVVFGALGVTVASVAFSVIYIIIIELYPTSMRNMGMSVSSIGSKVGAMVAPFLVNINTPWVASLIFSAVGFSAIVFCLILPETKGKELKDTIDDIK